MKKTICTFVLFSLILLNSCGVERSYRHIDSLDSPKAFAIDTINDSTLTEMSQEDIAFLLGIAEEQYENGFVLMSTSGASIDEVGVFVAAPNQKDTLYQKLDDYVRECQTSKEAWLNSYNPQEAEKLKQGKAFVIGDCVGYVFLDKDKANAIQQNLESLLKNR